MRIDHIRVLPFANVAAYPPVTMKTTVRRSRRSALLSNSRWLSYATAGAASALAGAHYAEGAIHFNGPINQTFKSCGRTATFQLDQPRDFIRLRHTQLGCSSYNGTGLFNIGALAGASVAGFYNSRVGGVSASNLKRGQLISRRPFIPAQSNRSAALGGAGFGQFHGGIGYIGFKFNNGSGDQYGWARVETRRQGETNPFILRDYAYGDVGDVVRAGQKSSDELVSAQGSLGLLSLGGIGLLAWRKRRKMEATN